LAVETVLKGCHEGHEVSGKIMQKIERVAARISSGTDGLSQAGVSTPVKKTGAIVVRN